MGLRLRWECRAASLHFFFFQLRSVQLSIESNVRRCVHSKRSNAFETRNNLRGLALETGRWLSLHTVHSNESCAALPGSRWTCPVVTEDVADQTVV